MRNLRLAAAFLFALSAASCGANAVIRQHNQEDAQSGRDITAAMSAAMTQCDEDLKSPDLDPIRSKISFDVRQITVQQLVLKDKPTPREQEALLAWAAVRQKCGGYARDAIAKLPLPPGMDEAIKERAKAGLYNVIDQSAKGNDLLTAALYERKITYGEFNTKRQELTAKIVAEHAAYAESWMADDKAVTLQKAAVVQKQAETAVAVLEAVGQVACATSKNKTVKAMC